MAETGASLGTIEGRVGISPGLLSRWLEKGRTKPKTQYRLFYNMFRRWVSQARGAAEAQQLVKAPTQWLERSTSSKILDTDESSTGLTAPVAATSQHQLLQLGGQAAIAALTALSQSGISIDESLKKGLVSINPTLEQDISKNGKP